MKTMLITGMTGLVGSHVKELAEREGWTVRGLSRDPAGRPGLYRWNPKQGELDVTALQGVEAVVHLAGAGIAEGSWTAERKQVILDSRVQGTQLLCEALAAMEEKPRVLVCASGSSAYPYGPRLWDESGPFGQSFLSQVVRAWEQSADAARLAGIRVVHGRFGVVLSTQDGALAKMLPFFKKGLGGPVGNGRQQLSWITPDDLAAAILHCIRNDQLEGAVNMAAPEPVSNGTFAQALGHAVGRPTVVPIPSFAIKLRYGQMGEETILADNRILPAKLRSSGFNWQYPEIEGALKHALEQHER
ncbi:MAG: TIGR01777 family oxidoreductase [Verrucomicrobiota bacterium JB022]|nr:TIGR01777 family oxidoreductase [Verrucomicrobiota bacterium JB022]